MSLKWIFWIILSCLLVVTLGLLYLGASDMDAQVLIWMLCIWSIGSASMSKEACPDSCVCHADIVDDFVVACAEFNVVPQSFPSDTAHLSLNFGKKGHEIDKDVFSGLRGVKSIVISGVISKIKTNAFSNIVGKTLNGNKNNTLMFSNARINVLEEHAFTNLKHIQIEFVRTWIGTIHQNTFYQANYVDSIRFVLSKIDSIKERAFSGMKNNRRSSLTFWLSNVDTIHMNAFTGIKAINSVGLEYLNVAHIHQGAFTSVQHLNYINIESCYIDVLESQAMSGLFAMSSLSIKNNFVRCMGHNMLSNATYLRAHLNPMDPMACNKFPIATNPYGEEIPLSNSTQTCQPLNGHSSYDWEDVCRKTHGHLVCNQLPHNFPSDTEIIELNQLGTGFHHIMDPDIFCSLSRLRKIQIRGRAEMISSNLFTCSQGGAPFNVSFSDCRLGNLEISKFRGVNSLIVSGCFVDGFSANNLSSASGEALHLSVRSNWINELEVDDGNFFQNYADSFRGNDVQCIRLMANLDYDDGDLLLNQPGSMLALAFGLGITLFVLVIVVAIAIVCFPKFRSKDKPLETKKPTSSSVRHWSSTDVGTQPIPPPLRSSEGNTAQDENEGVYLKLEAGEVDPSPYTELQQEPMKENSAYETRQSEAGPSERTNEYSEPVPRSPVEGEIGDNRDDTESEDTSDTNCLTTNGTCENESVQTVKDCSTSDLYSKITRRQDPSPYTELQKEPMKENSAYESVPPKPKNNEYVEPAPNDVNEVFKYEEPIPSSPDARYVTLKDDCNIEPLNDQAYVEIDDASVKVKDRPYIDIIM
ncbi:hypothetical protein CAPTEDRAFT_184917 [Capitella teleta]|uniref:Uncharacterized protein n=1 Tax=Capitella teleta TaxID=283909 RepID=X1ZH86_CAPTE|nr:hypothetical protein CAPTEDRAFT_184917 [Capitella teleta]|eukprot:ELT90131.1 hypothetical protein CAPTEDRAFT_184917 [Capitella teleta]